jgi:hypothetical protein
MHQAAQGNNEEDRNAHISQKSNEQHGRVSQNTKQLASTNAKPGIKQEKGEHKSGQANRNLAAIDKLHLA